MTLRFLLRPWCWVVGHRVRWVSVVPPPGYGFAQEAVDCVRCGKRYAKATGHFGPLNPSKGESYWSDKP